MEDYEEEERNFERHLDMQRMEMDMRVRYEEMQRTRNPQPQPGPQVINLPVKGKDKDGKDKKGDKGGKDKKHEDSDSDSCSKDSRSKKGKAKPPKGGKRRDDCSESDSYTESDSGSDRYSWSTGTGSRSSDARYHRSPNRNRRRSHNRYDQRRYIDGSPQIAYAQPYAGEVQRALPYNPWVENYVPVLPAPALPRVMLHQRPIESRRDEEFRRDAEEYVRARSRALAEAKYRDRRRFYEYVWNSVEAAVFLWWYLFLLKVLSSMSVM